MTTEQRVRHEAQLANAREWKQEERKWPDEDDDEASE